MSKWPRDEGYKQAAKEIVADEWNDYLQFALNEAGVECTEDLIALLLWEINNTLRLLVGRK